MLRVAPGIIGLECVVACRQVGTFVTSVGRLPTCSLLCGAFVLGFIREYGTLARMDPAHPPVRVWPQAGVRINTQNAVN